MARILLLGLRDSLRRRLEEELRSTDGTLDLNVEAGESGATSEKALEDAAELDALVLAARDDRVLSIARRAARIAPRPGMILLCPEAQRDALLDSLRLTPGIGPQVRCLAETDEGIAGAVVEAARATRRRRALHRDLHAMSERLDRSPVRASIYASSQFVDRLLDRLPVGVAVADARGRAAALNPAAERLLGYSEKDALGRRVTELLPAAEQEDRRALEKLLESEAPEQSEGEDAGGAAYDARNDATDDATDEGIDLRLGDRRILSVRSSRFSTPNDETATLLVLEDVTSRRRMEAQLRQVAQHEALGRLSGGVAHHFNNLLTVILFHAEELERGSADPEAVKEIRQAAERAADLTRQLLAFGRRQLSRKTRIDLVRHVLDLASLLERSLGDDVRLELRHGEAPLPVRVDPGQVEQVLVSLAFNARDAMPEGGVLRLELGETVVHDASQHRPGLRPGRYALLVARDDGCGMGEDVREHVFEPFYTTKEVGRGTGLGLAAAYGIVHQNDGRIYVESEPEEGTEVFLYLPLAEEATEEAKGEASPSAGGEAAVDRGEARR